MPLKSGSSQAAISANIKIERAAGKPEKQAIAIAESKARGDCNVEFDADCEIEADDENIDVPTEQELEKAIEAGRQELKHQEAALKFLKSKPAAADRRLPLAMDRRVETLDGILHVYDCNITKANVCPYLGSEIPGSEALGLDPAKIYMLYRDAAELQAAVKTYDRIQLLMAHVAVNPDAPQQFITVGTISNARFAHPYVKADLTVWTREGIEAIGTPENPGKMRELSCGYHYKPDMSPGTTPEGVKYDGRMTSIVANHISLVEAGRAGPDVMVADSILHMPRRLA